MKVPQGKFPSEIFGVSWDDRSKTAARKLEEKSCRFAGGACDKKGHVFNPFGACSVHIHGEYIPICPKRIRENGIAFQSIAKLHFGTPNNIIAHPEVNVKGIGSFDFVLVRHEPAGAAAPNDFAILEIQGGQTTSTGHLTRAYSDFLRSGTFQSEPPYNFGINYYDLWKRSLVQLLTKGVVMETWGTKIYWVIPKQLFADFQSRYRLGELPYNKNHGTVFALCDLKKKGRKLILAKPEWRSITTDQLFYALRHNVSIPSLEEFRKTLEKRAQDTLKVRFQLSGKRVS